MLIIVISGSSEMSLNDHPSLKNITLAEYREVFLAFTAIQVVHPPE